MFIDTEFLPNDSGNIKIRQSWLPSGKTIALGIALGELTPMRNGKDIDFDKESDEIIKKLQNSKTHHAFEYDPSTGFYEVDTKEQKWFTFSSKK